MINFELNGARANQAFYLREDGGLILYKLNTGKLPKNAFEYAKKKFGIKEIKPKKKEGEL